MRYFIQHVNLKTINSHCVHQASVIAHCHPIDQHQGSLRDVIKRGREYNILSRTRPFIRVLRSIEDVESLFFSHILHVCSLEGSTLEISMKKSCGNGPDFSSLTLVKVCTPPLSTDSIYYVHPVITRSSRGNQSNPFTPAV